LGVIDGDAVRDVTAGGAAIPLNMIDLIAAGKSALADLEGRLYQAPQIPLKDVTLNAPITKPGKILALGKNYSDHAAEMGGDVPDKQMWFAKMPTTINGPFEPIPLPAVSSFVDYEVELVAVIGARTKIVPEKAALDQVFGYCVGNDVTARDWQKRTSQFTLGKSFDGHAPIGPWITTADEVSDPQALDISCHVNGAVRQSSNTGNMVFSLAQQIAELSQVMTLEPGDLIFTGTPSGVGAGMSPPSALQDGDRVSCEIEGLGALDAVCEARP